METTSRGGGAHPRSDATIRTLVVSQHEAVRRHLVAYLGRSPHLNVDGLPYGPGVVVRVQPDVLVLDLGQLSPSSIRRAIDEAVDVGAGLIALASMPDVHVERRVLEAGGLYRLKGAGADRLAEAVREVAILSRPLATSIMGGNGAAAPL